MTAAFFAPIFSVEFLVELDVSSTTVCLVYLCGFCCVVFCLLCCIVMCCVAILRVLCLLYCIALHRVVIHCVVL